MLARSTHIRARALCARCISDKMGAACFGDGGALMQIQRLYEFLALTSSLNFTETAENFYISQSVLSDHISRMEKELDVRLFVRDRHSVRLTDAGRLFKEDAQAIVSAYERGIERLARYRSGVSTVVRIGSLMGSYGAFLPILCERYRVFYPEVEFHFQILELADMIPLLNSNEIDIAFSIFSQGSAGAQYEHRVLYSDCYKLAVPRNHPLASRKSVHIADLAHCDVVVPRFSESRGTQMQVNRKLESEGVTVRSAENANGAAALMATLVSQNCVALTPDHLDVYGCDTVAFVPIEDLDVQIQAGPLWKRSKETDVLQSFVAFLESETEDFSKADFTARKAPEELPWKTAKLRASKL